MWLFIGVLLSLFDLKLGTAFIPLKLEFVLIRCHYIYFFNLTTSVCDRGELTSNVLTALQCLD